MVQRLYNPETIPRELKPLCRAWPVGVRSSRSVWLIPTDTGLQIYLLRGKDRQWRVSAGRDSEMFGLAESHEAQALGAMGNSYVLTERVPSWLETIAEARTSTRHELEQIVRETHRRAKAESL